MALVAFVRSAFDELARIALIDKTLVPNAATANTTIAMRASRSEKPSWEDFLCLINEIIYKGDEQVPYLVVSF